MARKKYTEEQLQQRIKEEMEKAYQAREQEERFRYVHERQDRAFSKIEELERRIYKLENKGEEAKECKCDCETRAKAHY